MNWQPHCYLVAFACLSMSPAGAQIQAFPTGAIEQFRPSIGAYFSQDVDPNSLQFQIDGVDIGPKASKSPNRWSWTPNYDLSPGYHSARLSGRTRTGKIVSQDWAFSIAAASDFSILSIAPSPQQPTSLQPSWLVRFSQPVRSAQVLLDKRIVEDAVQISQSDLNLKFARAIPAGSHQVQLQAIGVDGNILQRSWSFVAQSKPQAAPQATVRPSTAPGSATNSIFSWRNPWPGQFTTRQPSFYLQFPENVQNLQFLVDGNDLTATSKIQGGELNWGPSPSIIEYGPHQMEVRGRSANGTNFRESWTFYAFGNSLEALEPLNRLLPVEGVLKDTPEAQVSPAPGSTNPVRPNLVMKVPGNKKVQRFIFVVNEFNVSSQVKPVGSELRFVPQQNLSAGRHTVAVICQTSDQAYYYRTWAFQVQ